MRGIMITADRSNSGKTVLNLGILRALKNRGLDVSAFKTGPDYVDPHFSSIAAKKTAHNLDIHLMGRENLNCNMELNLGEFAVVEGAMGYFDGNYLNYENSSYDISLQLNLPAILVYTPKGEAFSIVPKLLGMKNFEKSKIVGIIFNKVNKMQYSMYKKLVENNTDLKVLGYLPYEEKLNIEAVNLGLNMNYSESEVEELIELAAALSEEYIDLDSILELGNDLKIKKMPTLKRRDIKIAIAKDSAFCFHYAENLKILKALGEVCFFSPINDSNLPDSDLYIFGGGYPENYKSELSNNIAMLESIKKASKNGAYIYAFGGGLMYLSDSLDDYPMVGVFKGKSHITDRLQNFGYCKMNAKADNLIAKMGEEILAKEFHYGVFETDLEALFEMTKPNRDKKWQDGYQINNSFGSFQHINWLGNLNLIERLIENIIKEK